MIASILILAISLAAVIKAADWFLGAAESIGLKLRLPAFVLGVLLVGFGTSLPELATSMAAVADGTQNIVIANIVGSNLANMLVIIGLSTFFLGTIRFDKDLIDLDFPLLFSVTVFFSVLLSDGSLSRLDGGLLIGAFLAYILYAVLHKEEPEYHKGLVSMIANLTRSKEGEPKGPVSMKGMGTDIAILVGSVVLLALGSKFSVDSLLDIVTELDIAVDVLTIVTIAIGTSLPELLVSFKALKKGQGDLVLGNAIGSSIFNMLLVGGAASLFDVQLIDPQILNYSIAGLLIAAGLLTLSGITRRIHAWEGAMFIFIYIALLTKLIIV
ncbi:MAG: calcium/sodium antiporter [Patescibacteria group bacterium]